MKKKVLAIAVITICLAVLASNTLAFFIAEDETHNIISSGGVDIKIEEWQDVNGVLTPFPEKAIEIMPNTTVSKIVNVRNLEEKAYIRARFEIIITKPDGSVIELSQEELSTLIAVDVNGDHWVRKNGDDSWWYHTAAVSTNTTTESLFTKVDFDGPNMTNEYRNCTVEIIVKAQGVQTANNGIYVLDAVGWPNE
ncbi:MAG: hypothetical protein IJB49_00370 [Clostridia bacterium]|nr:hypothetical protein [Clostridia bacterium]